MINQLSSLIDLAKSGPTQRIALAAAADDDALVALDRAVTLGVASGILVGAIDEIKKTLERNGLDASRYTIIDAPTDPQAAMEAVKLVSEKKADLLMKGHLSTSVLLKAVLDKRVGLRTDRTLSHVALMQQPGLDRLVFITDAAMNIAPNLPQKASIIQNAADVARCLGCTQPKVALLAAGSHIDERLPQTLDAAVLSKMGDRHQLGDVLVDGPISLDAALSPECAALQGVTGPVAGNADILMVSHLEAGNVLYKGMVYFADGKIAGVLAGAKAPVILTSRADTDESKLNSIALGAIVASKKCEVVA